MEMTDELVDIIKESVRDIDAITRDELMLIAIKAYKAGEQNAKNNMVTDLNKVLDKSKKMYNFGGIKNEY